MPLTDGGGRQVFLHPTDRRKAQRKLYGSVKWERVRARVLERDGYLCQVRASKKCRVNANTVDHIIRPEEGGAPYDESNLRASCRSCNMVRHNAAYFREKVDAAQPGRRFADPYHRPTAEPIITVQPSGRPPTSAPRFLEWALSLPLVIGEPADHHHGRWDSRPLLYLRGGPFAVCPSDCRRGPERWRLR